VPGVCCKCGRDGGERDFRRRIDCLSAQQILQTKDNKREGSKMKLTEMKTTELASRAEWLGSRTGWVRRRDQYQG
jgi:hypothetical protein